MTHNASTESSTLPTLTQLTRTEKEDHPCPLPFPHRICSSFCSICQLEDEAEFVFLPCDHSFHTLCFLQWLHFNHLTCPNCNQTFVSSISPNSSTTKNEAFFLPIWTVRNVAISCEPTLEGAKIRQTGWYNIQLQIIPPRGIQIHRVKYVFHPAFNISKLAMHKEPFDLLVKLCSSGVFVLIEVEFSEKIRGTKTSTAPRSVFVIAHKLEKEVCSRCYFENAYNGLTAEEMMKEKVSEEKKEEEKRKIMSEINEEEIVKKNIDVSQHFSRLLPFYSRPADYYRSPVSVGGKEHLHHFPANVTPGTPIVPPYRSQPSPASPVTSPSATSPEPSTSHSSSSLLSSSPPPAPTIPRNSSIARSSSSLFAAEFNTSTGLIRSDSVTTLPPSTRHPSVGIATTTDTMEEGMLRDEESMELDADLSGADLSNEEVRNVIAACLAADHFQALTTQNHQH